MGSQLVDVILADIRRDGLFDSKEPKANNLTNDIHTLLCRERWPGMHDSHWVVLEPVLRLSTRLLSAHASFLFFYSIINAKRKIDSALSAKHGANISVIGRLDPYRHKDQPIRQVREDYAENLKLIASHLKLGVIAGDDHRWSGPSHLARTIMLPDQEIDFQNYGQSGVAGNACHVFVRSTTIEHMLKLEQERKKDIKAINELLRVQFHLAVVICHELAHVVGRAVDKDVHEPFWEEHRVNELGHVWEQEVFGGCVTDDGGHYKHLYVTKFPTTHERETGLIVTRRDPKGSSTAYYIPMPFIQRTSLQVFWDRWFPTVDDTMLFIPKHIGWRTQGTGPIDPEWRRSQSSEGRWPANSDKMVVRPLKKEAAISIPAAPRTRYASRSPSPTVAVPGASVGARAGEPA